MTLLELKAVSAGYGAVRALNSVDVVVEEGEFVVLLGPNGAGKTTTMRVLSGLLSPTAGTVSFRGRDITRMPGWRRVGMGLGHVPEGRQIFPDHTVADNLMLGAFAQRRHRAQVAEDLEEMYGLFPRLKERRSVQAGYLSGGEQQMLVIGRALMSDPKVILLDEPSLGLAPRYVERVVEIVRSLNAQGISILLVEQRAQAALRIAGRGYVLETGRIVLADEGARLLENEDVKRAYLGI